MIKKFKILAYPIFKTHKVIIETSVLTSPQPAPTVKASSVQVSTMPLAWQEGEGGYDYHWLMIYRQSSYFLSGPKLNVVNWLPSEDKNGYRFILRPVMMQEKI